MPTRPKTFGQSDRHKKEARQQYDRARGTAAERGPYNHRDWPETRRRIALRDLYACQNKACGRLVGIKKGDYATDHIIERKPGEPYDPQGIDRDENLQTLCVSCHNAKSGRYGRRKA